MLRKLNFTMFSFYALKYSILIIVLLFSHLLYILGVIHYVTNIEENNCKMTYMFEYPQYVKIKIPGVDNQYPRYGLYAYGEGFITEKIRKMSFSGIPVLFIPGNAGSHKQVRSLASISLRMGLKDRKPFHFDFFTVSFGQDYSALYGGVLMDETNYVSHCIQKILDLYEGTVDNVVLIGHSMGGIITKGALLLTPDTNISHASIIINLATPYSPSLILDKTLLDYYKEVKDKAKKIIDSGTNVISISGGSRDILVTTKQAIDNTANLNVLSTSIPEVWRSTDHLSILWCKQLIIAIVRSLYDSVDYMRTPHRISSDTKYRMKALSYHFLQRGAGKKCYQYPNKVQFESKGIWIEYMKNQYVWNSNQNISDQKKFTYLMIRLSNSSNYLTIEAINLNIKDWLFICSASHVEGSSRICQWGWNLTNRTRLLPDHQYHSRKTVDLNFKELNYPRMTHIIIRIPPNESNEKVKVNVDLYSYNDRIFKFNNKFNSLMINFDTRKQEILKTLNGNMRYYILLNDVETGVVIKMEDFICTNSEVSTFAIVELIEPHINGSVQIEFFSISDIGQKIIKLQSSTESLNNSVLIRITQDPQCSCSFSLHTIDTIEKVSYIIRDQWQNLYMIIMSILILNISILIDYNQNKMLTIIISITFCYTFGILFEAIVALGIIYIFAILMCLFIIISGSIARNFVVRFIAHTIMYSISWSDWLLGGLCHLPIFTTVIILSLFPVTCGALVVCLSAVFSFLKLLNIYEDYLEELLLELFRQFSWIIRIKKKEYSENFYKRAITKRRILNHLFSFLLLCFTVLPAIPSVLVWAKFYSYETRLSTEDPLHIFSWLVIATCNTLEIAEMPTVHKGVRSHILVCLLKFTGWFILIKSTAAYQWIIPPIVSVITIFVALNNIVPYK